jgi:uncharacterized protein (UPF0333 family)
MKKLIFKNNRGYVALSSVLVILVVIISLGLTVTYSSITESQSGLAAFQGEENLHQTEGCVEDALLKIRSTPTAVASVTRPEGSCTITYTPTGSGPVNWDMTVTFTSTTSTNIRRSIRVVFVRNPTGLTLTSWDEI